MLLNSIRSVYLRSRNMSILATTLKYSEFGEPGDVIKIHKEKVSDPKDSEVLVKVIAAPINPADINTIQGKYPVKPEFPATGGNECVAEVIALGPNVKNLKISDHVVPFVTGLGTWTSHAVFDESKLLKVPTGIGIAEAATINVNPCTAYRMLKDFVNLKPGDTVLQNGANSAVGQAVHQLCKAWNINSVGVVRDRPEIKELSDYLKSLGASEILTEEGIRTTDLFKTKLKKPKLALNCVGGKSATELTRHLDHGGVIVTYGGMSREPVTASVASLIFKDLIFRGFWMTRWTKENHSSDERFRMFEELFSLMASGKFKAPVHEMVPISDFKRALDNALAFKGFVAKKFILDFSNVSTTHS